MNTSTSSSSSITALVPGGVVTTQNISTVIKPKENNNSMQFVKIQTPELHKSAVEQIRVADESKISKNKIKEVEEEWQSNLLNWKSKRRQQFVGAHPNAKDEDQNNNGHENGRKIKTFAEMIEQRAKTGNRLNFHLQRYIGSDDSEHSLEDEGGEPKARDTTDSTDANDHSNLLNDLDLQDQEEVSETNNVKRQESLGTQKDSPQVSKPQPTQRRRVDSANSASSTEDDDQGEQAEQKHLQRVAFVAKLKAFERMTQPTMEEPKFVPTRVVKQTPPPPCPAKQQSPPSQGQHVTQKLAHSPNQLTPKLPQQVSPPQRTSQQHRQQSFDAEQLSPRERHLIQPHQQPRQSTPLLDQVPPKTLEQISPPPPPIQRQHSKPEERQPPEQRHHVQPRQPQSHQLTPSLPQPSSSPPQLLIPKVSPDRDEQQMPAQRHHVQPRQSAQPHQPPPPPKMLQQTSPQLLPQQQNLHKDEKAQDRTVLSVSGKKRCSSCREELGRGAAAFVIESLNLVYHTNCFRCSVCHVNLSNGFRGVDVRVHAGALHCQNCYSKDGLNYSRV